MKKVQNEKSGTRGKCIVEKQNAKKAQHGKVQYGNSATRWW